MCHAEVLIRGSLDQSLTAGVVWCRGVDGWCPCLCSANAYGDGHSADITEDGERKRDSVTFQEEGRRTELGTLLSERKVSRSIYSQVLNI